MTGWAPGAERKVSPAGDAHVPRHRGRSCAAVDDEVMALGLAADRLADRIVQLGVGRAIAQHAAQVGLVVLTEAHIKRAGAGQPHAVAAFAEIVRHRRDEADAPPGLRHVEVPRRSAGPVVGVLQRPAPAQPRAHDGERQVLVRPVAGDVAHRHRLDQAEIESMIAAPGQQAVELVLVHPLHRDRVDLDREPGFLGGEDAVHGLAEFPPAGDLGEFSGIERVERNIDPPHARRVQAAGQLRKLRAVGGDESSFRPWPRRRAQALEQGHHIAPDQGLAAGDAYLAGPQADEGRADAVQLLKRQHFPLRQERHVLGHAVDAAKVAAVGDRYAEIGDGAAERIDHWCHTGPFRQLKCAIPARRSRAPATSAPLASDCGRGWKGPGRTRFLHACIINHS